MKHIHGYGRASTDGQGMTLAQQKFAIETWAETKAQSTNPPLWEYNEFYFDRAKSGTIEFLRRQSGDELFTVASKGDIVVVTKLDRMFRDTADTCLMMRLFRDRGIHLKVLNIEADPLTDNGAFMYEVLAVVSSHERRMCSTRTSEGLQFRKQNGVPYSNKIPWGYRKAGKPRSGTGSVSHQRFVPNDAEREWGYKLVALHDSGTSMRKLARMYEQWRKTDPVLLNRTRSRRAVINLVKACREGWPVFGLPGMMSQVDVDHGAEFKHEWRETPFPSAADLIAGV